MRLRSVRDSDSARIERARDRIGTPLEVLRRHGIPTRGKLAICPFHGDRNPSLSVFQGQDGKWRWMCFGCEAKGDALDLEARLSGRALRDVIR